ncbi:FkbM family methyltransferase [Methylobacterium sp. CM6244]
MFTCYAQNFEDVLLWRALKDIPNGFYVDIGAQDPHIDSVSRGFYENGWRGFSIEPTQAYADKLRADRPDERIIQAAIGTGDQDLTFFEFPETGLSTADATVAAAHKAKGYHCVETVVPVLSLDRVLRDACRVDIHWLKIDVEGFEASVLESWGDCDIRPWIVVIESMEPLAQTPVHHVWESELLQRGYQYAYFDGLNRYYLSETHIDLAVFFGPGANIFDRFEISLLGRAPGAARLREAFLNTKSYPGASQKEFDQISAQRDLLLLERDRLANDREALVSECDRMRRQLTAMVDHAISAQNIERLLSATRASTSWRVTAPLRVAKRATQGDFTSFSRFANRPSKIIGLKRRARSVLARASSFLRERPSLRRAAFTLLDFIPPLRDRLLIALQHERAERAIVKRLAYTNYALSVEPERLTEWHALIDALPSNGKVS